GEDVADLGRGQAIVDGDRDQAAELAGRKTLHVFRAVLRQHRDPVAAPYADTRERIREPERARRKFAVRDRAAFDDDRRRVREQARIAQDDLAEHRAPGVGLRGRPALFGEIDLRADRVGDAGFGKAAVTRAGFELGGAAGSGRRLANLLHV